MKLVKKQKNKKRYLRISKTVKIWELFQSSGAKHLTQEYKQEKNKNNV